MLPHISKAFKLVNNKLSTIYFPVGGRTTPQTYNYFLYICYMIKHYFEFRTSGRGMKEIGEPEGFDAAAFTIEQRLHGRDVAFADAPFKIYAKSDLYYAFEYIQYELQVYGYNADIRYHCSFNDEFIQIGEVDSGETLSTNEYDYYSFNIVEENLYTLIKKRFDMEQNMFSDRTVDNNYITPLIPDKILTYSIPGIVKSEWKNDKPYELLISESPSNEFVAFNYGQQIVESEIKNTLGWYLPVRKSSDGFGGVNDFALVQALDNFPTVTIEIPTVMSYDVTQGAIEGQGFMALYLVFGDDYPPNNQNPNRIVLYNDTWGIGTVKTVNINQTFSYTLSLQRTQKIWLHWLGAGFADCNIKVTTTNFNPKITARAVGYNSIINGIRMFNLMKQCAKAISNNDILAPRWEMGGEFHSQFASTQDLMRNIADKPLYLSNKFISEKYLPEVNGDYEVQKDGKIFYGIYQDFYRNIEIYSFDHPAAADFEKVRNPDYYCNQFSIKFDNYQSQKEIEQENSGDIVHGEAKWSYPGKRAQNSKEISIGVIRDPLLIEVMRRKAVELSKDTATQDDKKVVLLDCVPNTNQLTGFTERALLLHTKIDDDTLTLNSIVTSSIEEGSELLNPGDPNFIILGVKVGSFFTIADASDNEGIYTVVEVLGNQITLVRTASGATIVSNEGINTTFTYFISNSDVPFVVRTTEGLGTIENITANDKSANLNFSLKNIALRYYNEFNATNLLYSQDKFIRNRVYYNNPNAIINGVREGDDFTATDPILTPEIIKATLFCTLAQWKQLEETLRTNRGYIRIFDANGLPARGYFKSGKWTPETAKPKRNSGFYGKAEIQLAEKYFPEKLTVVSDTGTILINNTIMPSSFKFNVNPISGKLSIFDAVGKRLNVPVIYKEVTINGVVPNSIQQLKDLMDGLY